MFNKILQNKKLANIIKIIGVVSPIIIIFVFSSKTKFLQKTNIDNTVTVPLTTNPQNLTINTSQPFTSPSKIEFIFPSHIPTFDQSINTYTVEKKLANDTTVKNITSLLNFYDSEKIDTNKEDYLLWKNNTGLLSISLKDNITRYARTIKIPSKTNPTKDEILKKTNSILLELFGNEILNLINNQPQIYFLSQKEGVEVEALPSTPEKSNLTSVNYYQEIDGLPVITQSQYSGIINITLDNNQKINSLNLTGGFLKIKKDKSFTPININNILKTASQKALKTTHLSSLSADRAYGNASKIKVSITDIKLGYFYQNDKLIPSYILFGEAKINNITESITYVISAIPEPE